MSTQVDPCTFSKRVLLCSVGRYPQVVTETLYALVTERKFIPTDIHVIGTSGAREIILETLLSSKTGMFHSICKDLNLENRIKFDESCIHIITDKRGNQLSDIQTPEDSISTADAIVDFVRQECEDEKSALHVSIAGGRKSLSFFLGYILSFFAQPQDTLSHVLVSGDYETHPDFFYPSQPLQDLVVMNAVTGRKTTLRAQDAKVTLADIPIIRLRNNLPSNFLREGPYSELIEYLDTTLDSIELRFDLEKKMLICDAKSIKSSNESVKLSPIQLTTILWLAVRKKKGMPFVDPSDRDVALEYLAFAEDAGFYISGMHDFCPESERAFQNALDGFKPKFTEAVSRTNSAIRKVLPEIERYSRFQVGSQKPKVNGRSRNAVYQLVTPSENITLPESIKHIELRKYIFSTKQ